MHWLDGTRPRRASSCVYCGHSGEFPHVKSYEHENETFSLYACTRCESLTYGLTNIDGPIVPQVDPVGAGVAPEARYVIETGFSSYHVAACALAALPDKADHELRDHVFVDVGAGIGMASYFMRTLFGLPTLTIEPSFTGEIAQQILGVEVHRAFLENLPNGILTELARKPCLLHLNSVVEHLVDPFTVLGDTIGRARVEVLVAMVPDCAAIDFGAPFLSALPFLAPRDHLHLPTALGMELMLKRLGFEFVSVEATPGLLTGIGSRAPLPYPSERTIKLAEHLFLENLMRHPNALVASGAASRLLHVAVLNDNGPLMAELHSRFPYEQSATEILAAVRSRSWDDLPFHLGQTCYWLAYAASRHGRYASALALLRISTTFGDLMAQDYPPMAMAALDYKWAAMLLESHVRVAQGRVDAAEAPHHTIIESRSDTKQGARATYILQAENALAALRNKAGTAPTKPE